MTTHSDNRYITRHFYWHQYDEISADFRVFAYSCGKYQRRNHFHLRDFTPYSIFLQATEPIITAISDKRLDFGYIPHWDAKKQSLFVTNAGKSFIRFDSVTKQVYEGKFVDANFKVDFFLPTNECENCFVTSGGLNMYIVNWDGFNSNVTFVRKVTTIPGIKNLTYVNTAKTDPRNRLLVATWRYDCCNPHGNSPNGSVFLIEKSNAIEIIDEARYPSGLEWDTVSSQMYYMDICRLNIRAYDWEANDGTVGKPRTIYDFRHDFPVESAKASYLPVGLGINCHGNLMVGLFNASTVAEINPT